MDQFFTLLRQGKFKVVYDCKYDETWSDEEVCQHVVVISRSKQGLKSIPSLPNAERVDCFDNELEEIGDLPKCFVLLAGGNKLRKLPRIPLVEVLMCYENDLEQLPSPKDTPHLTALSCHHNKLKWLATYPKLKWLNGRENPWTHMMSIPSHPRIICRGMIFTHMSISGKAMK